MQNELFEPAPRAAHERLAPGASLLRAFAARQAQALLEDLRELTARCQSP